jgi:hypothetical protein
MSNITRIAAAALLTASPCRAENAHEGYDFNFDGHADYCVKTLETGHADKYDVFLFDPANKSFKKYPVLSGTINPVPDKKQKQERCIWPGGHSGAIYSGTVYDWDGKGFSFAYSVHQSDLRFDEKALYVRVKAKLEDGVPVIESIERIDPNRDE